MNPSFVSWHGNSYFSLSVVSAFPKTVTVKERNATDVDELLNKCLLPDSGIFCIASKVVAKRCKT